MRTGFIELVIALVLATTVGAAGCSGNSDNGGGGGGTSGSAGSGGGTSGGAGTGGGSSVTSISGSKPLNTLTAAESTQLCNDAIAYFKASITKSNSCKFSALVNAASTSSPTDAALQGNCSGMETSCNASATMGPGAATSCFPPPATCTATVEQYSACISNGVASFNQNVSALPSCSAVRLADLSAIFAALEATYMPAGCVLPTACADFFFPIAN
jgi:hypothetical protein